MKKDNAIKTYDIRSMKAGDKVIFIPEGKTYDFGYIGATGKIIIFEEGETNIQDSFAVDVDKLKPAYLEDEAEPYCHNCGESNNLKYNEQYANGEYWTCKQCGENFFFTKRKHY